MTRARAGELRADVALSTTGEPQCIDARTSTEHTLAEILANILDLDADRLSIDSHFFDDLGADSLVMARFCARVRKRDGLLSISMQDVYQHPTIRRLAAALAETTATAPPAHSPAIETATPTSAREYLLCGALQAVFVLAYAFVALLAVDATYTWVAAGAGPMAIYIRSVLAGSAGFLTVCALPIAAKWVLVGRWQPRPIRLWSLTYVRFWVVKTLVRCSPASRLFVGTALYALYLKALGAKIGRGAVIFSRRVPVCTDLLTVGAGTVIRREAIFNCYRAEAGRIRIGAVTLGRGVLVGERSVLDIDTSMSDGAQLGHASALNRGQTVPAHERWHGCPARRTDVDYARVAPVRCGPLRRGLYATAALLVVLFIYLPCVEGIAMLAIDAASSLAGTLAPTLRGNAFAQLVIEAAILSVLLFATLALVGLLSAVAASRALSALIAPDTVYPLFGVHDAVHRAIARIGRMKFFTFLFGDSSYIVNFLQWLGYRLAPVEQTGSNFGSEVTHANPSLSYVGTGTMIADGLILVNDEVSSSSFRVSRAAIGTHNFVGNDVVYPAGGRTGHNVLLGTKVMVPLDGKVREGVGLLGAPCFEIPRTVERDTRFDHLRSGEALRRGLGAKNRYNLRTIGLFLLTRWLGVFVLALAYLAAVELYDVLPRVISASLFALSIVITGIYFSLVHRCVEAPRPVRPTICSIYDRDFWLAERLWKVHPIHYLHAFDGTPFKNVLWRLMGARIGRRVFDDGAHISDPSLTAIGDESVLNYRSKIQCHSQEDGTFKCDRTAIGARCSLGVGAFVLYGVSMGDGSALAADAFLMKGEEVPTQALWGGNPAKAVSGEELRPA